MCRTYAVKLFWIFCMNAVPSELMTLLSPGLISPPSDGSSSYAPQQGQHRYAFHLPSLRTYNLGWFGMIYCWFLLLSPSFHQFIGAGKGGISAAAKQPGRCFLKKIYIHVLTWELENSLVLMYRVWMWAETGSCSFSSFRWINSVPASSSR